MALPALPFVTGIVLGGLTTFLYMDKGSKNKIRSGAAKAASKVSDGALKVKEAFEPETDADAEAISQEEQDITDTEK